MSSRWRAPWLHFLVLGSLLSAARVHWRPAEERAAATDETLLRDAAHALGFDRTARGVGPDGNAIVVRRHQAELMRLATTQVAPSAFPSEAALEQWYRYHGDDFITPERMQLTHVFVSRARHGPRTSTIAIQLLHDLQRHGAPAADVNPGGDGFVLGASIGGSAADVDRTFGPGFARALANQPVHRWLGPITSTYGLHLVWLAAHVPATALPFAAVRSQVVHRWLREEGARQAAMRLATLRTRSERQ